MKKTTSRSFTCILIVIFIASTCFFAVRPAHAAGTVALINVADGSSNFNFTSPPKNIGDTFTANVTIADAVDLGTWQTLLSWNSALLGFVSITYPSDEVFTGKSPIRAPPIKTPGNVLVGAAAGPGSTGFTGNGRLAQFTFNITQAVGSGETVETDIQFIGIPSDTFLLDSQGIDITASFNAAHYRYSGPGGPAQTHDIAVTNVAPASTSVTESATLNISVTVTNTGNFTETFNIGVTANGTSVAANQIATSLAAAATKTLTFTWNTTSFLIGSYNIVAAAGPVTGETNTLDNTRSGGIVQIVPPGADHDIEVLEIVPRNTAIGQGFILNISVTVANTGIFTETFDVAVFANATQAASNQTAASLNPGANVTLVFRWNTTGWTIGNYTLNAIAGPVAGDTDTDNTLVFESIYVMLRGDVNNDGAVNMKDIIDILNSHAFNAFSGTARYKPYMDMDANGRIDMRDILAIVLNFSKRL